MNIAVYNPLQIICKGLEIIIKEKFFVSNIFIANSNIDIIEFSKVLYFDVIIVDVNESQTENFLFIKKVKNIQPKTNILLFSSFDDNFYISNCIKSGASGFLHLNSNKDVIINTIASLTNGSDKLNDYFQEKDREKKLTEHDVIRKLLSEREYYVVKMLIEGLSNKEIGYKLSLAPTTISTFKSRILKKTNCKNTLSLSRKMKKIEGFNT